MVELWAYVPFALALAASGVVAGLIAGLFGVGGGIVMVPALSIVLGILGYDPDVIMHVAVATSLATIIPTGYRSARAHHKRGAVSGDILKLWVPFIVVASLLGGLMAGLYTGTVLRIIFGVFALFIAFNTIAPIQRELMSRLAATPLVHRISATVIGYVSALMGVGGGALSVPTMASFGMPMHTAVGTGSALGVFLAVPGTIGFIVSGWLAEGRPPLSLGFVNLPAFAVLAVVASLMSPIGAALAHKLDAKMLKLAFAGFLALVGLRMLWQSFAG